MTCFGSAISTPRSFDHGVVVDHQETIDVRLRLLRTPGDPATRRLLAKSIERADSLYFLMINNRRRDRKGSGVLIRRPETGHGRQRSRPNRPRKEQQPARPVSESPKIGPRFAGVRRSERNQVKDKTEGKEDRGTEGTEDKKDVEKIQSLISRPCGLSVSVSEREGKRHDSISQIRRKSDSVRNNDRAAPYAFVLRAAKGRGFKDVVKHIETSYGAKKVHVPMLGLANFRGQTEFARRA